MNSEEGSTDAARVAGQHEACFSVSIVGAVEVHDSVASIRARGMAVPENCIEAAVRQFIQGSKDQQCPRRVGVTAVRESSQDDVVEGAHGGGGSETSVVSLQ